MTLSVPSRFAISAYAWKDHSPEALLDLMVDRFGIGNLDYWPWNRGELELPAYRDLLDRRGVQVSVINVPSSSGRLGILNETARAQTALLAGIDEAVALGAEYVQFYTGVPERPEFLTVVKTLAGDLRPVLERAEERGITLLLENNVDQRMEDAKELNPSRRPEMVLAVLEAADSARLRLAYDPCNFLAAGHEGYPYAYDLLQPYIVNVHMKDCCRFSPLLHADAPNHDHLFVDVIGGAFLPVPVGHGALNWEGLFRRLDRDDYTGWLTLDPFSNSECLLDWCRHSLEFIKQHVDRDAGAYAPRSR